MSNLPFLRWASVYAFALLLVVSQYAVAQFADPAETFPGLSAKPQALLTTNGRVWAGGSGLSTLRPVQSFAVRRGDGTVLALELDGAVNALQPDGTGGWYIGGDFSIVQGQSRKGLARVDANGQLLNCPTVGGSVKCLITKGDTLFVGGEFTTIGGSSRRSLGAVRSSNGDVLEWHPDVVGTVRTLALWNDTLLAGGTLQRVDTFSRQNFVALHAGAGDTGTVHPLNIRANSTVFALHRADTSLYLAGIFTAVNGFTRGRGAEFSLKSRGLTSLNPQLDATAYAVTATANLVYFGGTFTRTGSTTDRQKLIAFTRRTRVLTPYTPGNATGDVFALSLRNDTLWVAGSLTRLNGQTVQPVLALDTAFLRVQQQVPAAGGLVLAFQLVGGQMALGGTFTAVAEGNSASLLAFSATQRLNLPQPDGSVTALVSDGQSVYVGGNFDTVAGTPRYRVARYQAATGALLGPAVIDSSGIPVALALDATTLYVATDTAVTAYDRTSSNRLWSLRIGSGVRCLAVVGNTLYVGGAFTGTQRRLGAWNVNTRQPVSGFNLPANGTVLALVRSGDTLFVGGNFDTIGTSRRTRVAALNVNTNALLPFAPNVDSLYPASVPFGVEALLPVGDLLLAGGGFQFIAGQSRPALVAFDRSNALPFGWLPDPDGPVSRLALLGDTLIAAGDFTRLGGVSAQFLGAYRLPLISAKPPVVSTPSQVFQLYPNPAASTVFIRKRSGAQILWVEAVDWLGRSWPLSVTENGGIVQLDVQQLPSQVYFLRIHTQDGQQSLPLVKQ